MRIHVLFLKFDIPHKLLTYPMGKDGLFTEVCNRDPYFPEHN